MTCDLLHEIEEWLEEEDNLEDMVSYSSELEVIHERIATLHLRVVP